MAAHAQDDHIMNAHLRKRLQEASSEPNVCINLPTYRGHAVFHPLHLANGVPFRTLGGKLHVQLLRSKAGLGGTRTREGKQPSPNEKQRNSSWICFHRKPLPPQCVHSHCGKRGKLGIHSKSAVEKKASKDLSSGIGLRRVRQWPGIYLLGIFQHRIWPGVL